MKMRKYEFSVQKYCGYTCYHKSLEKEKKPTKENHKGSNNNQAKLNESNVIEILKLSKQGESTSKLSQKFNIHMSTIRKIKLRKLWKHITIV